MFFHEIAFFDSGIGGLSVLHHAMRVLPHEQFVFYADEDHVPYGSRRRKKCAASCRKRSISC